MAPRKKANKLNKEPAKETPQLSTKPEEKVNEPSVEPENKADELNQEPKKEVIFLNLRIPGTQYSLTIDIAKEDCKEPPHCHTYFINSEQFEEMDEVSLETCIFEGDNPKTPLNLRRLVAEFIRDNQKMLIGAYLNNRAYGE